MALVCLGLMALTTVGQTSGKKGTWKLVWQEEFDNKAGFDTTSWSKIPRGTADWNNYMSDFDSCYAVRDGNMVLRGIVNYTQKNDTVHSLKIPIMYYRFFIRIILETYRCNIIMHYAIRIYSLKK